LAHTLITFIFKKSDWRSSFGDNMALLLLNILNNLNNLNTQQT